VLGIKGITTFCGRRTKRVRDGDLGVSRPVEGWGGGRSPGKHWKRDPWTLVKTVRASLGGRAFVTEKKKLGKKGLGSPGKPTRIIGRNRFRIKTRCLISFNGGTSLPVKKAVRLKTCFNTLRGRGGGPEGGKGKEKTRNSSRAMT